MMELTRKTAMLSRASALAALLALALFMAVFGGEALPLYAQGNTDYDTDADGLIEVSDLAQLNAMRWDLDGDGTVATGDQTNYDAAFPDAMANMGCLNNTCAGYELDADLDFDSDGDGDVDANDHSGTYWNSGAGWLPIGDGTNWFNTTFYGNGNTISNLFISRASTNGVGLFGVFGTTADIKNLGLVSVEVEGDSYVGGLAGASTGTITNVFVTGSVSSLTGTRVAGLVGALAGTGTITTSYTAVDITGVQSTSEFVAGLVGDLAGGTIKASYARGSVSGDQFVAGLVAWNRQGTITAGYAAARVSGGTALAGLVANNTENNVAGTVTDSYWDTDVSGITTSAAGTGYTTSQLRNPTSYTGLHQTGGTAIYANWNLDLDGDNTADDPWDFGTAAQYPVLKVDFDGDGTASWAEFGNQRTKPDAPAIDFVTAGIEELTVSWSAPDWDGGSDITAYDVRFILTSADETVDSSWTERLNAWQTGGGGLQYDIRGLTIGVSYDVQVRGGNAVGAGDWSDTSTGTPLRDYDGDDDGLIEVSDLAQLNAMRWDLDGDGTVATGDQTNYDAAFPDAMANMGCLNNTCAGYELTANLDFDSDGDGNVDANDHNGTYWNSGAGWDPIRDGTNGFNTTFYGNGNTISNLFISRASTNSVGLFGFADSSSDIKNVGLVSVEVEGDRDVGGLAGASIGDITNVFVTGSVSGKNVAGLVGVSTGTITTSYTAVDITGGQSTGGFVAGLVAELSGGTIKASYARGSVSGGQFVAGLVAWNRSGTITASYVATRVSAVTGNPNGLLRRGTATNSYWDTDVSGITTSAAGTGYTTSQLRNPTSYAGTGGTAIYANWNLDLDGDNTADDPWDFGTAAQYPVLKVDFDGDGAATWAEFGSQRTKPDTPAIDSVTKGYEKLTVAWSAPDWDGGSDIIAYDVRFILTSADETVDSSWTEGLNAWQSTTGGNLQYDITGLTSGAGYDVQVRASNVIANTVGTGKSGWSDTSPGTPKNSDPTFDDGATATRSVDENSPAGTVVGTVQATDPGNDPLTYVLSGSGSGNFKVDGSGQITVSSTAELDYETTTSYPSLTLTVRDSKDDAGAQDSAIDDTIAVTINVIDVNEAPVFSTGNAFDVAENTQAVVTVAATDEDASDTDVSYQITGGADSAKFELGPGDADLRFKAAPDYENPTDAESATPANNAQNNEYVLVVTATSADPNDATRALTTEQTITVTVTDVNEAPVFTTADSFDVAENTQAVVTVAATDDVPSDTQISYQITGGADSAKFELGPGDADLRFKAAPDYENPTDAESATPANNAQNNEYVLVVTATSADPNDATRTLTTEQTITVTVTDVNEAPSVPVVTGQTVTQGTEFNYTFPASTDPEGHAVDYSHSVQPSAAWLSFDATTRTFSGTPNVAGDFQVTITATDSEGLGVGIPFQLTVVSPTSTGGGSGGGAPVNRPPVFSDPSVTRQVAEGLETGDPVGSPVTATDPDDDEITYTLAGRDRASFVIEERTGQIRVGEGTTLDFETKRSYSLTVTARDEGGRRRSATVDIEVGNVDEAGTIALSSTIVETGTQVIATLSDPDGSVSEVDWQWQTSADGGPWAEVSGATSQTYAPVSANEGKQLRVLATYTDGHGPGKEAVSSATAPVLPSPTLDPTVVSVLSTEANSGEVVQSDPVSATNPVQVQVHTPNAGRVTVIVRSSGDTEGPTGFDLVGATFEITAPTASVDAPIELRFLVLTEASPKELAVFKDRVVVVACTENAQAVPGPCVSDRMSTADGVAIVTVLTTEASDWQVGVLIPPSPVVTPEPTPTPVVELVPPRADEENGGFPWWGIVVTIGGIIAGAVLIVGLQRKWGWTRFLWGADSLVGTIAGGVVRAWRWLNSSLKSLAREVATIVRRVVRMARRGG